MLLVSFRIPIYPTAFQQSVEKTRGLTRITLTVVSQVANRIYWGKLVTKIRPLNFHR